MPKAKRSQLEKPVLSQEEFLSSTYIRTDYLWPFSQKSYWRFKMDPRWPDPVVSGGGREIYRRADIDRFLRRLADEGMTPEVANALDDPPPSPSIPAPPPRLGKPTKAKTTRPRRPRKAEPDQVTV